MKPLTDSIKVLHVDDEPDFADMAGTFLEREDDRFDIETAPSATEGLDRLASGDFDCVVSDHDMPGQSGIEFLEAVREVHPDLPFLLFTGKGSEEIASDAISAGVTDYLQKESGTEQYQLLAKRITDAVEHHHAKTSYHEIFEKVPDGVVIHDPTDGSFTDMNSQYAEMFGYERAEMLEAGFAAIHPDEEPYTVENARQLVREAADQGSQSFEWPGVTKDGDQFWAEVHLTPTQLHGNERILAVVRDISDRKERERRLKESERTYRTLAENFPDGAVGVYDRDLRYDLVEGAMWEYMDADAGDLEGNTIHDVFSESVVDDIEPIFRAAVDSGETNDVLTEFEGRTLRVWATPLRNSNGEIFAGLSFAQDITDQVEREQELAKSEARYRALAENFPNGGVFFFDDDLRYQIVSGGGFAPIETNPEDLVGNTIYEVEPYSEETIEMLEPLMQSTLKGNKESRELSYEGRVYQLRSVPIRDDGEVVAGIYITQDITEQRERERELERTLDLLEHTEQIADVGGWEIDTETQDVFWTDHLFEMLGRDYDEEPPLDEALDVYVEDDRPRVETAVEAALAAGESFDVEARFERPDGEIRWFQIRGEPNVEDSEVMTLRGAVQDTTKRKAQERVNSQRRHRLEQILKTVPECIIHIDESGQFEFANDRAEDVLGLEPDEATERTYNDPEWDIRDLDGNPIPDEELPFSQVRDTGEPVSDFRHTIEWPDGTRKVLSVNGAPLFDEEGDIESTVFALRDITDRIAEERKRERIIERVTDAILEINADWEFTLVNEQAEQLIDMDEEHLLGRDLWEVFTEAQDSRFEEEYRRVMETREPTSFVEYYSGLDGWFDIKAYPKDDGGIALYFREVTDRIQRSRELEHQHEQFQFVEDVADIGYWEIDTQTPEPHEVTLSDGVYHVYGRSPDEPWDVKKGIEFYHPEDRQEVKEAVERAVNEGEPHEFEARLISDTGSERWVHSVGEPVKDDGEVVKVRGVFQDITERKRKEQELARQNERLDEFASIVSHDLRNPLNMVEGRLELAKAECDSEELGNAEAALDRCQTLVDDLLTLAREGQGVTETEPVSLEETVSRCWATVDTADATLRTNADRTLLADRSRLQQLLENLVRNAIDHVGPDVTIEIGILEDGFYVADNGPGIPKDDREQVFESAYSTVQGNTGFGLAIVSEILDAHGWDVAVTESASGGARFEITGVEFTT